MPSRLKSLNASYSELSSLYKNPTRDLRGIATSDQDAVLVAKHAEVLSLFNGINWGVQVDKSAIYFKVLALLYEVDDYRGMTPSVERTILQEPTASVDHFNTRRDKDHLNWQEAEFSDPDGRSLWKAKVLCCVAAVESRRKSNYPNALLHELNVVEEFVQKQLHRPGETPSLPAWTTLAFVRAAQARVARQGQDYTYVRDKLLSVVECLDERASEIIEKLSAIISKSADLQRRGKSTRKEGDIKELEDDLIFIRQKQTLAILFNVGLDHLQRGFLDSANQACQAARFQFRLHGQAYHGLFNELLMIAIKRARTSTKDKNDFLLLEAELKQTVLPHLEPKDPVGNPKLYVYALRELAVLQHVCGKAEEMGATLHRMERVTPLGPQWRSRINLLHSRALYGGWRLAAGESKNKDPSSLQAALDYSEAAFKHATGGKDPIASYSDVKDLLAFIKNAGSRNLIDTMESMVTYGTVQLFFRHYFEAVGEPFKSAASIREAMKTAEAVIGLSGDCNPRLLAMGHLVLADAYREANFIVEARRHLEIAKTLEVRIQHKYVEDRRIAIEEKIPTTLTLYRKTCGHISQAEDTLLGWYIGNCKDKSSVYQIAKCLAIGRGRVVDYIKRHPSSPLYQLLISSPANRNRRRGK